MSTPPQLYPFAVPFIAARWSTAYTGSGGSLAYSGDAAAVTDVVDLTVSAASVGSVVSRALASAGARETGTRSRWPDARGDVMVRVDFASGNTDADGAALVGLGGDKTSQAWCALRCGGDGNCRIVDSTGADLTTDVMGPDSGERTGGNLWLRFLRSESGVAAAWGVAYDSDSFPEVWFYCGVVSSVAALQSSQGGAPIIGAITTGGAVAAGLTVRATGVILGVDTGREADGRHAGAPRVRALDA